MCLQSNEQRPKGLGYLQSVKCTKRDIINEDLTEFSQIYCLYAWDTQILLKIDRFMNLSSFPANQARMTEFSNTLTLVWNQIPIIFEEIPLIFVVI